KREALESPFKHIITRSVGFERIVTGDLVQQPLLLGDCFLLCTDGLSNHVQPEEMATILRSHYYRRVPQILTEIANDRGGDDNITIVLVYAANERGESS